MFCSNCGKDCGNLKICPVCGYRMEQDSYYDLNQPAWKNQDSFEIPKGRIISVLGYIQLEDTAFRIRNRGALFNHEVRIPYNQITKVLYIQPNASLVPTGTLIVRWKGSRKQIISTGYARRNDKTAIELGILHTSIFYHVFCLLRALAPATAVCEMRVPPPTLPNVDAEARDPKLDKYFEVFSPNRPLANECFARDMKLPLYASYEIIRRGFDIRQEELYAKDPSMAIRDLNRILWLNPSTPGAKQYEEKTKK